MQTKAARQKRFNKKEWSWIMYDWANSVYATNIMAAIYPTIFAGYFEGGDKLWAYGTSVATLIVAILAPILGAIADFKGMKKKLFTLFMLIGVIFTPLMVFLGNWKVALIGYVISHIGFNGSCLFYDSFLTDVTTDERMDKVSSWGYAMGYIGGSTIPFVISIVVLLVCGFDSKFAQVFSVLIVSLWWLVFSIPMLKNVEQEHYVEKPRDFSVRHVFANVWATFKKICTNKGLLFFILAYFFYIDGVGTIISISTAYGTTLGLGAVGMIIALLVTQLVAMPCSILFAKISEKFSARKALIGAVAVYLFVTVLGFYMGYSMEPSQKAYNEAIRCAYTDEEAVKTTFEGLDLSEYRVVAADIKKSEDDNKAIFAAEAAKIRDDFTKEYMDKNPAAAESGIKALKDEFASSKAEAGSTEYEILRLKARLAQIHEGVLARSGEKVDAYKKAISFSTILFWIMAVLVGTVQGGIQAVSRSYFGKLIPKKQSNEHYGFFDIFGKFASFMGPFLYASIGNMTGRASSGVLALSALFLIGLILLIAGRKSMEADERLAQ